MTAELRKSGIDVLGDIPWGAHLSQFYETKTDLLELLVPYFKAGLENNEFCLWIICEDITQQEAFNALQKAVPNLTDYVEKKSIEFFPGKDWYINTGTFDAGFVNNAWLKKLQDALTKGYRGMRINGNETWLDQNNWNDFMDYEKELNQLLHNRQIIVLCTYPLTRTDGSRLLDVAHAHECIISRRRGRWEILEEPGLKKQKAALLKENKELDALVAERTNELAKVVDELKNEIEERKKTEELLTYEKGMLQTIIDSIPGVFVVFDENFRFLLWNKQYEIVHGRTAEEMKTLHAVEDIFAPEDVPAIYKIVEQTISSGHYSGEFYGRRINGSKIATYFTMRLIQYEDKTCVLVIAIDVTERKKAEDELKLAYQRLSYHVQNTPLAVVEWDKDLIITRWSGQAEKVFGWKAAEALGKHIYNSDFRVIFEEDWPRVEKMVHELMYGSSDRNINLNRNYRKDGKVIYCEWYNSILKDEQGNVITFLAFAQDVTERKEAEDKLNESYRQIRLLSEHLQNVREEERIRIAREIHDELGQHLTVLQMDVSWLNKKVGNTSAAVKEKLHDLMEVLSGCVQTIRRISYELRPHLLDLGLGAAIEYHLKEFEKRSGIKTFFKEPEEELELSNSTKTSLFRIFQESLTNVARHSEAERVYVDILKEDQLLSLRIEDNGKGFDKKAIAKKRRLGILGMKERCEMMGGTFYVESEPGKGTAVTATMPFTKETN